MDLSHGFDISEIIFYLDVCFIFMSIYMTPTSRVYALLDWRGYGICIMSFRVPYFVRVTV